MKALLRKVQKYSEKNGIQIGMSLILETDESGFIAITPYASKPFFEFNDLDELYKELDK